MTMGSRNARLNKVATRRVRSQAALWVTELHGPDRDAALEARVKRWISEDPTHAAAFELATEAWQRSGNVPRELPAERVSKLKGAVRRVSRPVLAGVALTIAGLMAAIYCARDGTLATGPHQQKTIELSDGTQVSLNANSRLLVQYDDRVRKVTLTQGEVLFDVAKHQARPFVVVIGDRKVIAVGTSFMVRRENLVGSTSRGDAFAVTLVEGRVAVEPVSWPDALPNERAPQAKVMNPGERLSFYGDAPATLDSPSIEKITAWRRGELIFDDASLAEAASEFNRYGPKTISIDSPTAGRLRVGGVFRIGDATSFALAMADTYHLRMLDHGSKIILTDKPVD